MFHPLAFRLFVMSFTATLLIKGASWQSARAQEQGGRKARAAAEGTDRRPVGEGADGRIVVPTNQVLSPAGRQMAFSGRPTDVALSPNGKWLAVLDRGQVLLIDPVAGQVVSRISHASGSYAGIVFTPDSKRILASNIRGSIGVFEVEEDGELEKLPPIDLPVRKGRRGENLANSETGPQSPNAKELPGADARNALPVGLVIGKDGTTLWAALNMRNSLAQIDLATGKVLREIPVGNAPYGVTLVGDKAYVSNWAGRHPGTDDTAAKSGSASPVRVDSVRHIASEGSVSVVDLAAGKEITQILVGLHPAGIVAMPGGRHVLVANANSDTISVIDTSRSAVVETISTRPTDKLLFGSSPSALAISPDGQTVYCSNGTNNAIAVIQFSPGKSRLLGCIPTGWYPAGVVLDAKRQALYVANVKGVGSRALDWQGKRKIGERQVRGFNSHDYLGTVSLIPLPTSDALAEQTKTVLANGRLTEQISALAPPRPEARPRPVPERHGEPSVIKHVLYIIKENRTYDQVFGDIEKGEGDPALCIFGRQVTPNHHKLVEEFTLLDNFYCSGVLSADGHQWTNEAYVTDYLEKAFGGWPRSYPYWGGDAMAYAPSGFIWDNVLAHRKTLRVYGEFVTAEVRWKDAARKTRPAFLDCYRDFIEQKNEIDIRATAAIKTLEPYLCPTAIGFPSVVPDIYRAEQFIRELQEFERKGDLPNFMIMLLPNDHTAGTRPGMPTPAAAVADNDLALGRIVEAISHSRFWKDTCIFVVQDDPQNGFDHIDGHRTVAMAISPYTRRAALDSTNYNQTSMVRTIELMLGLPPMNQLDASATPMTNCFMDEPDPRPYTAVANNIPLDQLNPQVAEIRNQRQRHWAEVSLKLPLDNIDEADEDTLNRILWHATRGRDDTYPAWAVLMEEEGDDDDEDEKSP
jgi:YVTN family beta-propeller protein